MLRTLKDPTLYSGTVANSAAEQLQEAASVSQVFSCSHNKCVESSRNPAEVQEFPLHLQWFSACLRGHFPSFSGPCSHRACCLSALTLASLGSAETGKGSISGTTKVCLASDSTGARVTKPLGWLVGWFYSFALCKVCGHLCSIVCSHALNLAY